MLVEIATAAITRKGPVLVFCSGSVSVNHLCATPNLALTDTTDAIQQDLNDPPPASVDKSFCCRPHQFRLRRAFPFEHPPKCPASLINRVEQASAENRGAPAAPARQAQAPEPVTVAELEQHNTAPTTALVKEQRPPSTTPSGGEAYDGAVSVGSVGLQMVEGFAVVASIPLILSAGEVNLFGCRGC